MLSEQWTVEEVRRFCLVERGSWSVYVGHPIGFWTSSSRSRLRRNLAQLDAAIPLNVTLKRSTKDHEPSLLWIEP